MKEVLTIEKKALKVIEGSLLLDEPKDDRLEFIYRMAHIGLGNCEFHADWKAELNEAYKQLKKRRVI